MTRSELIELLRDPGCYPHPTGPIRVVETHISWVVLTGRFAYKIKKPVRFSFVDFSTLARRRHFCEEELRLNRRFAPALYLGLSRVTRQGEAIRVDAADSEAAVVEYAVRLREFARSCELTQLIAGDTVDVAQLREFGRDIGGVHADAPCADIGSDYGSADTIRNVVTDNLDALEQVDLPAIDRTTLATIGRRIGELGDSLDTRMQRRRSAGMIRECHGDLHAGNVVQIEERLAAFDCLEFDPALRFIDIASDAAFLFMDLCARQRPDLAYGFLDGWLERAGDFEGIGLISYYSAYRALVRAKVIVLASTARGSGTIDPAVQARARIYLEFAAHVLAPRRPVLIVMVGMSGSGKSWLSERLVASQPAIRIRSDVERKRLAGFAADQATRSDPGGGLYTPEFNRRTYARLVAGARHALRSGENVILDAAFLKRAERDAARGLADEVDARCILVACTAPIEVLRQRIRGRAIEGRDASEATVDVLERQRGYFESFTPSEERMLVTVDTTAADPGKIVAEAIAAHSV